MSAPAPANDDNFYGVQLFDNRVQGKSFEQIKKLLNDRNFADGYNLVDSDGSTLFVVKAVNQKGRAVAIKDRQTYEALVNFRRNDPAYAPGSVIGHRPDAKAKPPYAPIYKARADPPVNEGSNPSIPPAPLPPPPSRPEAPPADIRPDVIPGTNIPIAPLDPLDGDNENKQPPKKEAPAGSSGGAAPIMPPPAGDPTVDDNPPPKVPVPGPEEKPSTGSGAPSVPVQPDSRYKNYLYVGVGIVVVAGIGYAVYKNYK